MGLGLFYVFLAAVILFPLLSMVLLRFYQRRDKLKDVNSLVCLNVAIPRDLGIRGVEAGSVPKTLQDLIAPMEQFYASLTTIIHQRHFLDWLFATPASVSFEVSSVGGVISFSIVCPRRIQAIIERQLHSYFPFAEAVLGRPPAIFAPHAAVAGAVFYQAKNFVLPLRTYRNLEADPLSAITNGLTKLSGQSSAVFQLLIRPISENWRLHTQIASTHVKENRLHLVNRSPASRIFSSLFEAVKPAAQQLSSGQIKPISAQQEQLLTSLQQKGSKTGFETILRVLAVSDSESAAEDNLRILISTVAQFHSPEGNSLRYRRLPGKRIGRDYLMRLFSGSPKMILNVEELTSIYHLPNRLLETPGLRWLIARTLPAPANLPSEGVVIGRSNYRGESKLIRLSDEDRRRHMFMIGKTGVGKTTVFETMIEQDMHANKGICFIDPLGDAIESLLKKVPNHRAADVILFDPSDSTHPLGLNLLEYHRPEEKDFLIQEVIEIFYKLFDPHRTGIVGPQWEHWARNAALTVMNRPEGGTLIDIPRLFMDDEFRAQSINLLPPGLVRDFWQQQLEKTADFHKSEMYNYFISKFGRFMTNDLMRNIIGQAKSSFNFREAMDSGKILLVNLAKGKIGEINANLLGLVLTAKLQVAAFSRADMAEEERRDFYLYVDEFQNFTTDSFATILAEARKYRLNLAITNQYLAQLTETVRNAVIGNVGTLIAYRVGAEDAEFLSHELPGLTVDDLTNLDRFQAYVKLLVDLAPTRPFSMMGVKSPTQGSWEMADWIRQASRRNYSKQLISYAPTAG